LGRGLGGLKGVREEEKGCWAGFGGEGRKKRKSPFSLLGALIDVFVIK